MNKSEIYFERITGKQFIEEVLAGASINNYFFLVETAYVSIDECYVNTKSIEVRNNYFNETIDLAPNEKYIFKKV